MTLPNASNYRYVHPTNTATRFTRLEDVIDLNTITNDRIEQLLLKDEAYWSQHFKKKQKRKKKSTDEA